MIHPQLLAPTMTVDIALVLGIPAVSLVLFVTEWVRMHVVSLLGGLTTLVGTPPNVLISTARVALDSL